MVNYDFKLQIFEIIITKNRDYYLEKNVGRIGAL